MSYAQGYPLRAVGGRLALDYLNTADWSGDGQVLHEKLAGPEDLSLWMEGLGLPALNISEGVSELLAFRQALRRVMLAACELGDEIARARKADLALLNDSLKAWQGPALSSRRSGGVAPHKGLELRQVIAASALALLADPRELARIKLCPGKDCGWLFLDETRNARRRWCAMETCGNRAKARRNYAKGKAAAPED